MPKSKVLLILIAANYLSAWVSRILLAGYLPSLADITIQNIQICFRAFVVVAFVVTFRIKFKFLWFALA